MFKLVGLYKIVGGSQDQLVLDEYVEGVDLDVLRGVIDDEDSYLIGVKVYDGQEKVWEYKRGRGVLVDKL